MFVVTCINEFFYSYLESELVVLVEKSSLGVTDVQVATGLGWEPHNHFAHLSIRQVNKLAALLILATCNTQRITVNKQ